MPGGVVEAHAGQVEPRPRWVRMLVWAVNSIRTQPHFWAVGAVVVWTVSGDRPWWAWVLAALVCAVVLVVVHPHSVRWRRLHLARRSIEGTRELIGLAMQRGLVNRSHQPVRVEALDLIAAGRRLTLRCPPGITVEDVTQRAGMIGESLGAEEVCAERLGPGRVALDLIDGDPLAGTVEPGFLHGGTGGVSADAAPDEVPWWEADDDHDPDSGVGQ